MASECYSFRTQVLSDSSRRYGTKLADLRRRMFHSYSLRLGLIAFTTLGLAAGSVYAAEWFKDGRIGAGADVVHQEGMPMASVALYPASVLVWEDNWGVGLTYPIGPRVGWSGAVGGIYVDRTDDDVGTNLNFLFRVSYCGEKLCASFAHISHGGALGIETDKANSGLNFLYLEYRYR